MDLVARDSVIRDLIPQFIMDLVGSVSVIMVLAASDSVIRDLVAMDLVIWI